MSNFVSSIAPWVIIGGGVFLIIQKIVPEWEKIIPDKERKKEDEKIGVEKVPLYGKCISDNNCIGGKDTSVCQGGECIPRVAEDGIGRIRFAANEIGLKKVCGRYKLLGFGDRCSDTKQSSSDGLAKDAADSGATSSTNISPYQCKDGVVLPVGLRDHGDMRSNYVKSRKYWYDLGCGEARQIYDDRERLRIQQGFNI